MKSYDGSGASSLLDPTSREKFVEEAREMNQVLRERVLQAEQDLRMPDATHLVFVEDELNLQLRQYVYESN